MKKITSPETAFDTRPCALALGTFDGLHRGHMAVLEAALSGPEESGVFTFSGSPSGSPGLLTREDREALLRRMGVSRLYEMDFGSLREQPPEVFVRELLFGRFRAVRLCCGEDFRFGKGAAGDAALLAELCEQAGASLTVVPPVTDGGEKVSSTRIRAAVERGDMALAGRLLGRPFGFAAEVVHGNRIGRELGTPTVNQAFPTELALPPFGVYASLAAAEGRLYTGVTNVGVKPTVGSDRVLAETWMPDFSGDLYGRTVRLFLIGFIRPERRFPSLEALREEIVRNAARAEELVKGFPVPELF